MHSRQPLLIFLAGTVLLIAAYWSGLNGPFLLDDFENLAPLWRHLDGQLTGSGVIFGNNSGALGRPVSMLSFLIDAHLWGQDAFGFKLTNLFIHVLCAGLIWRLLALLLPCDPKLSKHARWLAPTLAVVWAVLPIHVSTVLYVVQRMAMLSALFVLLALLAYVTGRRSLQRGKTRSGFVWLTVAFPLLTFVAALCKENGVLAIPLAAAIEFTCFCRDGEKRPWPVSALFAVSLALPLFAATAILVLEPARLLDGYVGRSFTLQERVLTEPRILWDYVRYIVTPDGPRMGLFHDNYPVSRSLLNPPATLLAITGWGVAVLGAWIARRRSPIFALGVLFFLAAHAMESTVLPLELYFEHRNYLASLGAIATLAALPWLVIPEHSRTRQMTLTLTSVACLLPAAYLLATHFRAAIWGSEDTLYVQEELNNATSPRLQGILAARAIGRGDLDSALTHIDLAEQHGPANERMTATIRRMLAYCAVGRPIPEFLYLQAQERISEPATQYGMVAWEMLAQRAERKDCQTDNARLADLGAHWVDHSATSRRSHAGWRVHYNSARLLASSGKMDRAAELALEAFQDSDYNFGVGVLAFQTCASARDPSRCRSIAERLTSVADPKDRIAMKTAEAFLKASQARD